MLSALDYIQPGMKGLDYGCGPGPALAELLARRNIECDNYDPFFYPNKKTDRYDFILSTEVFEHLYNPSQDIENIASRIKPGGFLGIMTVRWTDLEQFKNWYYLNDDTHVIFFHRKSFEYICDTYSFDIIHDDGIRVIILKKNPC
ncbi:MAG: class I SAM-dependent methyltransferase [Candidatus Zixiibacteriota bacterium]